MQKAIVLTDGKAGHENQSKAFARALGLDFELVPVKFKSPLHKALSYLLDRLGIRTVGLLQGLDGLSLFRLTERQREQLILQLMKQKIRCLPRVKKRFPISLTVLISSKRYMCQARS